VATLAFSATGTQLPTRGFIPTIFFGVAVVLATAFLAFIIKPDETTDLDPSGLPRLNSQRKADSFVLWVRSDILTKAPLLRGAAVALLFGVMFLPVAMVTGAPTAAAEGGEATASAEPSWPPFPEATPLELAAVLYSAQLEAYREDLDAAAASTSTAAEPDSIESTAWSLAVIGLGVVLLVTLPFWARFAPSRPDANDRPRPGPMRED
jgi:hypothetical protein